MSTPRIGNSNSNCIVFKYADQCFAALADIPPTNYRVTMEMRCFLKVAFDLPNAYFDLCKQRCEMFHFTYFL